MSCCGKKRKQIRTTSQDRQTREPARTPTKQPRVNRKPAVYFEYVGNTRLRVIGPATGTHYRFEYPGAQVLVNPRDRRSLAAVPHLRQLTRSA